MRKQFNCSNASGLCDRCGKGLAFHESGDYYCPSKSQVRRISAFLCDFGCKRPSHEPGCPFFREPSKPSGQQP